jgi:hypothetical protein
MSISSAFSMENATGGARNYRIVRSTSNFGRSREMSAKPGEKRELATGQPRINPHRDRRWVAADK